MAKQTFTFQFEELPLVLDLGFEAGLVNGSAEINFWPDGSWGIESIALDGHRRVKHELEAVLAAAREGRHLPVYETRMVHLDRDTPLFLMIFGRLEGEWREQVQDEVAEAIHADRESRADTAADQRRAREVA